MSSAKYLSKWLNSRDPIHRGWTGGGIANGLCATHGVFFPRTSGGYNLYRAVGSVPNESSELVGAAEADAGTVETFPWVRHEPDTTYVYRLVPIGGGGVENWSDVNTTTVRINEAGLWVGNLPNAPTDLWLAVLSGGRFAVHWAYLPQGQQAEPVGFHVYSTYEGLIDYGSVRGTVYYDPGQVCYEYVAPPHADGEHVGWAVRAYHSGVCEEQNTNAVFGTARQSPPPVNPTVEIAVV